MTYRYATSQTLTALGDSTRRAIFERVARRPVSVGEIARDMPVSRPAVSQHLKVLKEAGLVTETREGASRIYRIDPRGIAALRQWLDEMWSAALENFAAFADADAQAAPTSPESPSPKSERKDP